MRTHYLALASCGVVIGLLSFAAWQTYTREAFEMAVCFGFLLLFAVLFTVDEWHAAAKAYRARFKQPPFTTERG